MEIVRVEKFGVEDLFRKLRGVTMLKDETTCPYVRSFMSLEKMDLRDIAPAQRYVLKHELDKVHELAWALAGRGFNIFELNGFLRIWLEGEPEPIDLLPPIVEETFENNHRAYRTVNDGMHRLYSAYLGHEIPQVVYVRGIPSHLKYYATPLPEGRWEDVELRDGIPTTYLKKWHRDEDNKKKFRNFNSTFMNVGGPRGNTK